MFFLVFVLFGFAELKVLACFLRSTLCKNTMRTNHFSPALTQPFFLLNKAFFVSFRNKGTNL